MNLLGLDVDGNLVLIELKRDRTPREIVAQVLDYASWVAALKTPQIHEIARTYLNKSLTDAFRGCDATYNGVASDQSRPSVCSS